MKALALAPLALWVVQHAMHPKPKPRTIAEAIGRAKAKGLGAKMRIDRSDWFTVHPNGGGV